LIRLIKTAAARRPSAFSGLPLPHLKTRAAPS
jgi:hypothetical protein